MHRQYPTIIQFAHPNSFRPCLLWLMLTRCEGEVELLKPAVLQESPFAKIVDPVTLDSLALAWQSNFNNHWCENHRSASATFQSPKCVNLPDMCKFAFPCVVLMARSVESQSKTRRTGDSFNIGRPSEGQGQKAGGERQGGSKGEERTSGLRCRPRPAQTQQTDKGSDRRIKVVANGLPGAQLADDTKLVSPFIAAGPLSRDQGLTAGAALLIAKRPKERMFPTKSLNCAGSRSHSHCF